MPFIRSLGKLEAQKSENKILMDSLKNSGGSISVCFLENVIFLTSFIGSESNTRLVTISMDKHPTFIGLINEFCNISTLKQLWISTFRSNGFTMPEIDLRLLYEAEDLSDQTGL